MIKFIAIVATSMMLSCIAGAHHGAFVNIEKPHKVIIKQGMSKHDKVHMIKCMLMLKKHKTAEEAVEAKLEHVKAKCEKHNLCAKKCAKIKHRMIKRVHACFTIHKFMDEFLGRAEAAPAETAKSK